MSEKKSDRALLAVAKANLKAAKWSIKETDEIFVNISLFNISQAAEKIVKFLCSCNGIDYDYSHFIASMVEKLLSKSVTVPQLVQDSINDYSDWATKARYNANQLALRSYAEKHIKCIEEWIASIEKQIMFL